MKNFIDIKDLWKSELIILLDNALQNKRSKTTIQNHLNGKNLVLFFEKKYKNWSAYVIGDEPRDKLEFSHPRLNKLGFKEHNHVINVYKKTSIAVVCSRWNEPFGRTALEASSAGCAVIISNKGGLKEASPEALKIKKLTLCFHRLWVELLLVMK